MVYCKFFLFILLFASPLFGDSLKSWENLGDLQTLKNWTGLSVSGQKNVHGDAAAKLTVPGRATFEYTEPKEYLGREAPNFADMLDEIAVEDWFEYRYIEFEVYLPDDRDFELEFTVYPLLIGRPDYMKSLSTKALIEGPGWQKVVLSLRDFDYKHHQATFWRFIKSVSISGRFLDGSENGQVLISQVRLKKGKFLSVTSPVRSRPAKPGEKIAYDITVANDSPAQTQVRLLLEETAWETCEAKLSETNLVLAPWQSKTVSLEVEMNKLIAPGGLDRHKVTVTPDGRGDLKEEIRFITVRYLQHPYLLHTEAGWQDVLKKAEKYQWAKDARQEYIDFANAWKVPKIRTGNYCYKLTDVRNMSKCAIAWKLSGDDAIAVKVIKFLRDFTDPKTGYPSKLRSNDGSLVHAGMFFMNVARAYDLLYNHKMLTPQDHKLIEQTMRLYSHWVNPDIRTGGGNNHQVSLVAGAIHCGLVLQDFAEVERYLYGTGGYTDLMGTGILDDGHYFEGTVNYNVLTANIASSIAVACEPWGLDVKNWKIPPKYGKFIMVSDWAMRGDFLGMSFERQGPSNRNFRQLKDIWDAVLPMIDYRGIAFATSDSTNKNFTREEKKEAASSYEMVYYMWRDPAYVPVIKLMEKRDLLYGVAELPDVPFELGRKSFYSDNIGFGVLRSKALGKDPRERIQAVQRYGTHGGYHGHFDKTSLASLSRFGKYHYNTEASWYGYWSFMFKMWVQTSDAHNMTVVDHRMQKPADASRILFHSGDLMQVSATEIETTWIDPPYGGQTPYRMKMPEEKTWAEARWLPTPENPRPQGDTGTPSEPILQRRLIVVTDDYVVMSDYLKGRQEHDFDNLFNCKGLIGFEAEAKKFIKHTSQCDTNPYSSAQFITNCDWYQTSGPVKTSFLLDWSKGDMGGRHSGSEPGVMNIDYYALWPKKTEMMIGNYPETLNVARHLYYKVIGDGKILTQGRLAPWILGKAEIDVDIQGVKTLEVETKVEKARDLKTIFLGNPVILTAEGKEISLGNMGFETENIAPTPEKNKDYAGGAVTIFGDDYKKSIAAEPADRETSGKIIVDLAGKKVTRFKATLGGDYPVGGDDIHRKIIAVRSTGRQGRFLSAVEIHEDNPVIKSIEAISSKKIIVKLKDGRTETIEIKALDGDGSDVSVEMTVEKDGRVICSEKTRKGDLNTSEKNIEHIQL